MKKSNFLTENFQFLEVKFSIYLNRRVFVMFAQGVKRTYTSYTYTFSYKGDTFVTF